jgi:hypothetical protein
VRCHHGAQILRACSEWKTLDAARRVARAHAGLDTVAFESVVWEVIVGLGALLL